MRNKTYTLLSTVSIIYLQYVKKKSFTMLNLEISAITVLYTYLQTCTYYACLSFLLFVFFSFFLCKLIKMNVLFFQTQCIVRESLRKKKKKTSSWIGPFLKDKAEKISTYIIQNFMYLMHI